MCVCLCACARACVCVHLRACVCLRTRFAQAYMRLNCQIAFVQVDDDGARVRIRGRSLADKLRRDFVDVTAQLDHPLDAEHGLAYFEVRAFSLFFVVTGGHFVVREPLCAQMSLSSYSTHFRLCGGIVAYAHNCSFSVCVCVSTSSLSTMSVISAHSPIPINGEGELKAVKDRQFI